jgi:hypothetical protein
MCCLERYLKIKKQKTVPFTQPDGFRNRLRFNSSLGSWRFNSGLPVFYPVLATSGFVMQIGPESGSVSGPTS